MRTDSGKIKINEASKHGGITSKKGVIWIPEGGKRDNEEYELFK